MQLTIIPIARGLKSIDLIQIWRFPATGELPIGTIDPEVSFESSFEAIDDRDFTIKFALEIADIGDEAICLLAICCLISRNFI